MSSTSNSQNLLVNVFRPTFVYSDTGYAPRLVMSNVDTVNGTSGTFSNIDLNDGASNVYVGQNAGNPAVCNATCNSTGITALGIFTGSNNQNCSNDVFMGASAGSNTSNVLNSVYLGASTGSYNSNCGNSVYIGNNTARDLSFAYNEIAIGPNMIAGGVSNVYIGASTGSSGSNNIFLGANLAPGKVNNQLRIGSGGRLALFADLSTGKVGIGTSNATAGLDVSGQINATGGFLMGLGTSTAPTIAIASNPTTGVYARDLSTFAFTVNGVDRLTVTDTCINVLTNFFVSGSFGIASTTGASVAATERIVMPDLNTASNLDMSGGNIKTANNIFAGGRTVTIGNGFITDISTNPYLRLGTSATSFQVDMSGGNIKATNSLLAGSGSVTIGNGFITDISLAPYFRMGTSTTSFQVDMSGGNISNSGTSTSANVLASGYIRNALTPSQFDISGGSINYAGTITGSTANTSNVIGGVVLSNGILRGSNGTSNAPSHTFTNDPSTGMHLVGTSQLAFDVAGVQRITLAGNNMGIGTTNPQALLDVSGVILLGGTTAPRTDGLYLQGFSNQTFMRAISSAADTAIFIGSSNVNTLGINSNGVVIARGTAIPSAAFALDVNGTTITCNLIGTSLRNALTPTLFDISSGNISNSALHTTGSIVTTSTTSNSVGGVTFVSNAIRNALTPTLFDISGGNISNSGTITTNVLNATTFNTSTVSTGKIGNSGTIATKTLNVAETTTTLRVQSSFDPRSIGTCAVWLDVSDTTTIATTGGKVTAWSDKSSTSNHFTQTIDAKRPTIGADGGVYFLTSNLQLVSTNNNVTTGGAARSTFAVMRVPTTTTGSSMKIGTGTPSANNFFGYDNSPPSSSLYSPTTYGSGDTTFPAQAQTAPIVAFASYDGAGTVSGSSNFGDSVETGATLNTIAGPWYMGSNSAGGEGSIYSSNAYMYEFLHFSSLLTIPQRQLVEGYLAWKWDLSSSLPVEHPYTNGPPSVNISNGSVYVSSGSATTPSYSFVSDKSTGIHLVGSSQLAFDTAGVQRMVISNSNVGIGTGAPAYTLEVSGTTSTSNAIVSTYLRNALTPTLFDISSGNVSNSALHTTGSIVTTSTTSNSVGGVTFVSNAIRNALTPTLFDISGGNISNSATITTSNIVGNTLSSNSIGGVVLSNGILRGSNGTSNAPSHTFTNDPSTGMHLAGTSQLAFDTAGVQRMVISNSNVGFGVGANPLASIDVSSMIILRNPGTTTNARLVLGPAPGATNYDYCSMIQSTQNTAANFASELSLWTHGTGGTNADPTRAVTIDSSQRVGIGILPQTQLDVSGSARIRSGKPLTNPTTIANCAVWLDASDMATFTMSGTKVAQWTDKSGTANHFIQVTDASRATVPDEGGLYFSNISISMSSVSNNATSGGAARTTFAVLRVPTNTGSSSIKIGTGSPSTNLFYGYDNNPSASTLWTPTIYSVANDVKFATTSQTAPIVAFATYDGTGTVSGSSNFGALTNRSVVLNTTAGLWYLGSNVSNNLITSSNGYIYEFLHYTTALTTTQRQQVEGYLAWKWNLVSTLPAGHPFSNAPPVALSDSNTDISSSITTASLRMSQGNFLLVRGIAGRVGNTLNFSNVFQNQIDPTVLVPVLSNTSSGNSFRILKSGIWAITCGVDCGATGSALAVDVSTNDNSNVTLGTTGNPIIAIASTTGGTYQMNWTGYLPSNVSNIYKIRCSASPSNNNNVYLQMTFLYETPTVSSTFPYF